MPIRSLRVGVSVALLCLIFVSTMTAQLIDAREFRNVDPRFHAMMRSSVPTKEAVRRAGQSFAGKRIDGEDIYSVILHTTEPDRLRSSGIDVQSVLPDRVTARATRADLIRLAARSDVRYIEASRMEESHNDVAATLTGARLLNNGYINGTAYTGTGVLVGIIDTGIDWEHLDFRDPDDTTQSRIAAIWDQTLDSLAGDVRPNGFSYGVEYSTSVIEDELDGSPAGFVREQDVNGHGTHVAGTAAGNGAALASRKYAGMAPKATLLVVKAGNGSFPTVNIIDALTWMQQKAAALELPIVVNMSLGSDYGSHDGTDSKSAAMNAFADAGRVLVVSAGNSGATNEHVSGTITGSSTSVITMAIPSYSAATGTDNDNLGFDLWFAGPHPVSVQIITPGGDTLERSAGGEGTSLTSSGAVYTYNFVEGTNGAREIYIEIYDASSGQPPASGTWTFRFTNDSTANVEFHGWLFDHNIGTGSTFVSPTGSDATYTLGNTAAEAVIVGSYVHRWRWYSPVSPGAFSYGSPDLSDTLSSFSSRGPTRTGAQKPDITAPGQAMVSALSSNSSHANSDIIVAGKYLKEQGTSMSSPAVAGCVALLLQQNENLSAASVMSLLTSTADQDGMTGGALPNAGWGYGKVDVFRAMEKLINPSFTSSRNVMSYDGWSGDGSFQLNAGDSVAVRFTPTDNGTVVGVLFHTSSTVGAAGPISASVRADNGSGSPGNGVGGSGTIEPSVIGQYTWNIIQMDSAGISVSGGQDYHAVLTYASGTATFLRSDNASVDGRTLLRSGGSWTTQLFDARIRPIIANDAAALPVELLSLSAIVSGNRVQLTWETATEIDNLGWFVERRDVVRQYAVSSREEADGKWKSVGFVEGFGTSTSPRIYSFADRALDPGRFAYRLRQVDRGGASLISHEVEVAIEVPRSFFVSEPYPNPFNPETAINVSLPERSSVRLVVYDVLGRSVVIQEVSDLPPGIHTLKVKGSHLASGMYFCVVEAREPATGRIASGVRKVVAVK